MQSFKLPDYANMFGGPAYTPFDSSLTGPPGSIPLDFSGSMPSPQLNVNALPGSSPSKGWFGVQGLGKNMETLNAGLTGFQTLAGLWTSLQAYKMAKKQYELSKATTNANLANQTQSYNTTLADRARSRGVVEGQSAAQVADYIAQNSLAKRTV